MKNETGMEAKSLEFEVGPSQSGKILSIEA